MSENRAFGVYAYLVKVETFPKNKHSHMFDIGVFATCEHCFWEITMNLGKMAFSDKLLELGAGFAFIGRQKPLQVGERDFFLDLLFYHTRLHCYVVIELKTGEFEPEYAGKLNFYLKAVDEQLRSERDEPSIGILLCKCRDLAHWLDTHGVLPVIRNGFKCYGRTFRIAFLKPAHGMKPELANQY